MVYPAQETHFNSKKTMKVTEQYYGREWKEVSIKGEGGVIDVENEMEILFPKTS